jgi:hypothetical protein
MRIERTIGTALAAILIATWGCSKSAPSYGSTLRTPTKPGEERCEPNEAQFPLVGGPTYVGVIVPEAYFSNSTAHESRGPTSDRAAKHGFWTPTSEDVKQAESGIRAALEAATRRPEVIGRRADGTSTRDLSKPLARILPELDHYRRQYMGVVVSGRRQIICRFFLPHDPFFRLWQCEWLSGRDWGTNLWLIRFDLESRTYEGFDVGS